MAMPMNRCLLSACACLLAAVTLAQVAPPPAGRGAGRGNALPPVQAKPEELVRIKEKTGQIEALAKELKRNRADPQMLADVEVYAKAGRMLMEFPELFATQ